MRRIAALGETRWHDDKGIVGADEITIFFHRGDFITQFRDCIFQIAFALRCCRLLLQFRAMQSIFDFG